MKTRLTVAMVITVAVGLFLMAKGVVRPMIGPIPATVPTMLNSPGLFPTQAGYDWYIAHNR